MARLKNPLLSLAALGRLGKDIAFTRRLRQATAQTRGTHPDIASPAQLSWRTMWQLASDLWHDLSAAEQATWEAAGTAHHMTGYAWFMSQALRPNPGIYLPLAGGTMSGDIDTDSNSVTGLLDPTQPHHAARKGYVDDSIAAAALGQGCRINRRSHQSIASGVPPIPISFSNTDFDNDGCWDIGEPTRVYFRTAGIYLIIGMLHWEGNPNGYRYAYLNHSVDTALAQALCDQSDVGNLWRGQVSTFWSCLADEYVELNVHQTSGVALDVRYEGRQSPVLSIMRVG